MHELSRILAATDLGPSSERAVRCAFDLARGIGARVTLLYTYRSPGPPSDTSFYAGASHAIHEQAVADLTRNAAGCGPAGVETELMARSGRAEETILATAREIGAELIVMGSHQNRGVQHLLLGSVAEHVARAAPCPVLVVPAAASEPSAKHS